VRSEESLQDGGNTPPVLVGVPEQLSREKDSVRVELPKILSGHGEDGWVGSWRGDPDAFRFQPPTQPTSPAGRARFYRLTASDPPLHLDSHPVTALLLKESRT
jgi:hypothetical protein